jgi:trichohyalin
MPIVQTIQEWKIKVESLVVTDESQKDLMKQAREGRLILKNLRVSADKERKAMKEESQKYLNTIQLVYNTIESMIKPLEVHLQEQENFVEIQEAKREEERKQKIAELQKERERIVQSMDLVSFLPAFVQLGDFSEEDFQQMVQFSQFKKEQKLAQEKQEEERKRMEAEERERILEASRLEQILEAERLKEEQEKLEEKLRLAKEENERIEKELNDKLQAEKKAEADRLKAERKLKNAPDKVKIEKMINDIELFKNHLPEVSTEEAKKIVSGVAELFTKIITFASNKNQEL